MVFRNVVSERAQGSTNSCSPPMLLHGAAAFPIGVADMRFIQKTQNMIQRTFIRLPTGEAGETVHNRWIQIHRKLLSLRSQGRLEDSVNRLQQILADIKFPIM